MSNDFDAALLRLKAELNTPTDKALAAALGMSATALNERKRRNAFPDDKLWALAAQRRDLDVSYVLHGVRAGQEHTTGAAQALRMKSLAVELANGLHSRGAVVPGWLFGELIDQLWDQWGAAKPDPIRLREGLAKALDAVAPMAPLPVAAPPSQNSVNIGGSVGRRAVVVSGTVNNKGSKDGNPRKVPRKLG